MTNTTATPWLLNPLCVTLSLIIHMCLAGLPSSTSECSTKMSGPRNTIAHLEHMNMVVAMKSGEKPVCFRAFFFTCQTCLAPQTLPLPNLWGSLTHTRWHSVKNQICKEWSGLQTFIYLLLRAPNPTCCPVTIVHLMLRRHFPTAIGSTPLFPIGL